MSYIRIILVFFAIYGTCFSYKIPKSRSRSCTTPDPDANMFYSRRGYYLFVNCRSGYRLFGSRVIQCMNGKWVDPKPVCAKYGCENIFAQPENGQIIVKTFEAEIICSDNYMLAGNRMTYCNGTHWDRPLGKCQLITTKTRHDCDFETEDLCGWFAEPVESHQWIRKIAISVFGSFSTGPSHDHTTMSANGGHYMLMESLKQEGLNVPLISPIYSRDLSLKTGCCFRFYYFMYGQGVGDLSVYIKPASLRWEHLLDNSQYLKFKKSGSQERSWIEEIFDIPEMEENFQIVFIARSSRNHLSDIAIDDVKLMLGSECSNSQSSTTDNQETTEVVEVVAVYDVESCQNRCFESSLSALENKNQSYYLHCSCHVGCGDSCCPDYQAECLTILFEPFINSSVVNTTTIPPTTTSLSTTTMKTTSTTTPKTTTTTIKTTIPSTTTTTSTTTPTTTTTTPKPTTTTTPTTTREIETTTTVLPQKKLTDEKKIKEKLSWKYEPRLEQSGLQKYQILEILLVLVVFSVILMCTASRARNHIKGLYQSWSPKNDNKTAEFNKNSDEINNSRVRFSNKNKRKSNNMNLPLIEADSEDNYL